MAEPSPNDGDYELVEAIPVVRATRPRAPEPMTRFVRFALAAMALGGSAVLGVALWLNPYTPGGGARTMATHTQLGMPPCNMVTLTGRPCPACGMTTSFALLMHADPVNSARANWVGTLLCAAVVLVVPWAVLSLARGRYLGIRSLEEALTVGAIVLVVLMLARWLVVILTTEPAGRGAGGFG